MQFKDLNFKIAIMGVLHDLGYYSKEAEAIKDKSSWDKDYEPIPEVLEFYKNVEIDPKYLAQIEKLQPDGGYLCHEYLFTMWDGEDDQLDIHSIEGIEHLVNLKSFEPISLITADGLDYSPLLLCPKLETVSLEFVKKDEKNEEVLKQLKEKGVQTV